MNARSFHSSPLSLKPSAAQGSNHGVPSNSLHEHPALLAQIRELIASDNYVYASQVLKQSGLNIESYGVPLALEAMKVFKAVDERSSMNSCAAYLCGALENPPMDAVRVLALEHCYNAVAKSALNPVLNRKASTLLNSLKMPKNTTYYDLFDSLATAAVTHASTEALELLALIAQFSNSWATPTSC